MAQEKKFVRVIDVVSVDRNWTKRVNSELESEKKWDQQWGYLSSGFSPEKTNIQPSVKDKIQQLEKEINELGNDGTFATTNNAYGKGPKVEMFEKKEYNIVENKQLRVLERRLPKNWKKGKWTPPVDPYDPVANMYKKKR